MKRFVIILALASPLAGCAPKRFSEFTGRQSWPTAAQAMSDNSFAVPVYQGWPDRPYTVIGSIAFANPANEWKAGDTAHAARIARRHGGNAMIMRQGGEFGVGAVAGAALDPHVVQMSTVTALVIRWKDGNELQAEEDAKDRFVGDYKSKHPDLNVSRELVSLASDYVGSMGASPGTPQWRSKLDATIDKVLSNPPRGEPAHWIFKGTLQSEGITWSSTEVFWGMARITLSEETITLASEEGRTDVNFSGRIENARVSGQMGVSSGRTITTGPADGVIAGNRILLNGQGQTAAGRVQSSFTFIR
jgi:hypothetical protein